MEVASVMQEYFGRTGNLYLIREIKLLGYESISKMDDETKMRLADRLMINYFDSVLSRPKARMMRSNLIRCMHLSQAMRTQLSKSLEKEYNMSRYVS